MIELANTETTLSGSALTGRSQFHTMIRSESLKTKSFAA